MKKVRKVRLKPSIDKQTILLFSAVLIILIIIIFRGGNTSKPSIGMVNSQQAQSTGLIPKCGDGRCLLNEDSSNCCMDCGCPIGYVCEGQNCKKKAVCGNGISEEGETSQNCCQDTGCPTGEKCQNNQCVELKPELSAKFEQKELTSVTLLKATKTYLGDIILSNSGNDDAANIKVTITSLNNYFSPKTINFFTLPANGRSRESLYLNFQESILDITSEQNIPLTAAIEYSNTANKQYEARADFQLVVEGRNYFSWNNPAMISSWVTPSQPIVREFASKSTGGLATYASSLTQKMAARWLFENMRAYGVTYTTDAHVSGDYVQFPIETLKNKGGDCEDNAVLYASLLEAVGIDSVVVLVPGHAFAGYVNKEGEKVYIETTASNFDQALASGELGYNSATTKEMIDPSTEWNVYNQVILPEQVQLSMPAISKQTKNCGISWSWSQGWIGKSEVTFTNSCAAPGAGCAAMTMYSNGKEIGDDLSCWPINPGETRAFDYTVDIGVGDVLNGYCYVY